MINVTFNADAVLADLTGLARTQLPFATVLGLNRTAEERQDAMQDHVASSLTIRGNAKRLFRDAIRFARADRADKNARRFSAALRVLGVDTAATAPVYQRIGSMLLRQEQAGSRTSDALYRAQNNQLVLGGFVIPAPGLRTAAKGVSRALYPTNIGLSERRRISGGTEFLPQYKGGKKKRKGFKKGTKYYFVKEGVGIFVRQQLGTTSEYDAVWFFRRQITIPKRIQLAETFEDGVTEQLARNIDGFLAHAIRTAKR